MSERVRLELRFKNATLYNALVQKFPRVNRPGYDIKAASLAMDVHPSDIFGFVSFNRSPWNRRGQPRRAALQLSVVLEISCDELFPVRLYSGVMPRMLAQEIDGERYLTFREAANQHLLAPSTNMEEQLVNRAALEGALTRLKPKDRELIEARYGLNGKDEKLLSELAAESGHTAPNERQKETRIINQLRKILRPSKKKWKTRDVRTPHVKKVSDEVIRQMRGMKKNGLKAPEIAARVGLSYQYTWQLLNTPRKPARKRGPKKRGRKQRKKTR